MNKTQLESHAGRIFSPAGYDMLVDQGVNGMYNLDFIRVCDHWTSTPPPQYMVASPVY